MMSSAPTLVDTVLDFNLKKVVCGSNHTTLLEENGNLIAYGHNKWGQVGVKNSFDEESQRQPVNVFQTLRMNENQN